MLQYPVKLQGMIGRLRYKYDNLKVDEPLKAKACHDTLTRIIAFSLRTVYDMGEPGRMNDAMRVAQQKIDAVKATRKRTRRYVRGMVQSFSDLYFVTLTFSPETYDGTSRATRDRYVKEWCRINCADYLGCLDVGKVNGREHYHLVVALKRPPEPYQVKGRTFYRFTHDNNACNAWEYGYSTIKKLDRDPQSMDKTLEYAMKATAYAFKSTDEQKKIRPFHARGVDHSWTAIAEDAELPF